MTHSSAFHKKLVILGAGESGTGAPIFAQKLGFDVLVSRQGNHQRKSISRN